METDEALKDILQEEKAQKYFNDIGFTRPLSLVHIGIKNEIVSTIITCDLFIKVKAVMDQFQEGLEMVGLRPYLRKYSDLMLPLFVDKKGPSYCQ